MASKICPSCGAKNPAIAYSCQNCATSLIDMPSTVFPSNAESKSWSGYTTNSDTREIKPIDATESDSVRTQSSNPVNSPATMTGQSVAVVRQSPLSGIMNALITSFFFLIFGFGAGLGSIGSIVSVIYIVAIVAIPLVAGYFLRPKYEFYDSHFLKQARGGIQQYSYLELESVEQRRGTIRIRLKPKDGERFRNRQIVIPGNPKISGDEDLASWLRSKIPAKPVTEKSSMEQDDTTEASF